MGLENNLKMKLELPILGEDIPEFSKWVAWNKFSANYHKGVPYGIPWHDGFDFAAYTDKKGDCILGLQETTPIRAIDDGIVRKASPWYVGGTYTMDMLIEHSTSLVSGYNHVVAKVKVGSNVRKGDVIATLYKDEGAEEGRLVHLHFYLAKLDYLDGERFRHLIDPERVFGEISDVVAEPQGHKYFLIPKMTQQPIIHIANFRELKLYERSR